MNKPLQTKNSHYLAGNAFKNWLQISFFFKKTTKQKHCSLINISVFWRSGKIPQKCIIIALGLEYLSHREYYTHTSKHQMCVLLVGDRLLWQGQC